MLVADVRKWIADVQSCLGLSSLPVDGVDDLQCELRETQVSAVQKFSISFYRTAAMQQQSCHEHLSVRPSVRPSMKHVNCDKTKETYVQILTPYQRRIHHLVVF